MARVLDAVAELSRTLTPSPLDAPPAAAALARTFGGWQRLLDGEHEDLAEHLGPWTATHLPRLAELAAPWPETVTGDTLAHGDLRADNILLTDAGRTVFVDWPHALRATAWFDLLVMLPCVRAQGGPDPEELFTAHPLGAAADPDAVTTALAAVTGYFLYHSLLPAPPGIPTVRAFQRAQGDTALAWLRRRLSLR